MNISLEDMIISELSYFHSCWTFMWAELHYTKSELSPDADLHTSLLFTNAELAHVCVRWSVYNCSSYICITEDGSPCELEQKTLPVPLCINSAVCTSLQKEDSQGLHLPGSHCTLEKREYAISWVKMKYNIQIIDTGLSVTSFLQGSS